MVKKEEVLLKIQGQGLSYEKVISEKLASRIIAFCVSEVEPEEAKNENPSRPKTTKESTVEYVRRHSPKRNPDMLLTLAGYLKDCLFKETFTVADIKSLFSDAREKVPANINRDFNWVLSNGWFAADVKQKDLFFITTTGLKVLEGKFHDDLVKDSKIRPLGRKK